MRTTILALAAAVAFAPTGWCDGRSEILNLLADKFQESLVEVYPGDGALLELFKRPDGATWTLLVTRESGVSCVLSFGRGDVGSEA